MDITQFNPPPQSNLDSAFFWAGIGMIILALVCFFVAWRSYINTNNFLKTAKLTQGTVIRINSDTRTETDTSRSASNDSLSQSSHTITTYTPVVQFTAESGKTIIFTAQGGNSNTQYQVDDNVPVLYQPTHPANARINSTFYLRGFAYLFLAMGGGLILFACICLYAGLKKF